MPEISTINLHEHKNIIKFQGLFLSQDVVRVDLSFCKQSFPKFSVCL